MLVTILATILALSSPIWVPILITGLYTFVIRGKLPKTSLITADKLYWVFYFVCWIKAALVFVSEIFSWQIKPLFQWLWLFGLGLPMLIIVFVIFISSMMASDSW